MGTEPDDVVVPLTEEGLREAAGEVSACVISRGHIFFLLEQTTPLSLFPVVKRSSALMLCPPLTPLPRPVTRHLPPCAPQDDLTYVESIEIAFNGFTHRTPDALQVRRKNRTFT